jgi:hypothetical protein
MGWLKKAGRFITKGDARPSHQFCALSNGSRLCLRCGGVHGGPYHNIGNTKHCSGGCNFRHTLPETDLNWVQHRELSGLKVQRIKVEMTNVDGNIEAIENFIKRHVPSIVELEVDINALATSFSLVETSDCVIRVIKVGERKSTMLRSITAAEIQFTVQRIDESIVQIGVKGLCGSASINSWSIGTLTKESVFHAITLEKNGLPGVVNLPPNVSRAANKFRLNRGVTSEDVNLARQLMFDHLSNTATE